MSELQQRGYERDAMPTSTIASPNEPHLACVLLVDTSSSMEGEAIRSLNEGINNFKNQVSMDEIAKKRIDVAIIQFNSGVQLVQDFVPIAEMKSVNLVANGLTAMGAALNYAIDKAKERNHLYASMGTPCFKPWIFMITDGLPTDEVDSAISRIRQEEQKGTFGKLKVIALGVGNYDKETLFKVTKRVLELRDVNFSTIFDWMAESMIAISVSRVNDEAMPARLPENARKADPDRDITEGWW